MKKKLLYILYSLLFFLPAALHAQVANHVVISQLYGSNGGTYDYDWIELYNPTTAPVDMSGWSVQYNSATGVAAYSGITPFPAGTTIKAHGYFMIQEQGAAGTTSTFVPTPDIATTGTAFGAGSNNFNMSGSAGKIALVNNSTIIAAQPTLPSASIIDLVSYGTTAVYYEGTGPAPAPSATTTIQRKASATSTAATMAAGGTEASAGNGYDTDDNASNFVSQAAPNPHNSASPVAGGGSSTPTPVLTPSVTTLDFGTTQTVGVASAAKSFTLSETNVPAAGATLTVAAPFAIATSATGTYGTTITFTQAQLATAQTVYVEFTPAGTTAASGNIAISSTGAAAAGVSLTGTGATAVATGTANHVVISQLYGSNGGTYDYDWIELYNPTSAPVDMSGWSVQYNSATGVAAYSGITPFPAGTTIKAHGYFMIQEQGAAGTTSTFVPTPDIATTGTAFGAGSNNFNMSGSAGKIALVNNSTIIAAQPTLPSASIIDLVSYGTTAVYYEGTGPAPAPSATTTIQRKASATSTAATMAAGGTEASAGNGYDTDDNASNFVSQAAPNPHNSASPVAGGGSSTPTPVLTPSVTTLDFGTTQTVGVASAAKSFTLSETNVPAAGATLTVAAPFAIATSATGTYGTTITFTQAQLATAQTVYVEFTPAGTTAASGNIAISSTGAAAAGVSLTGTGVSASSTTLTTSTNLVDFGTAQTVNTTSAAKSFTITGANIGATGVTVTVTAPYSIATTAAGTYGTTITFTQAQMAAAQTVYVEFTPTTTAAANVNISIASTGATTKTVALAGAGITASSGGGGTGANHVVISQLYGSNGGTYDYDWIELYNPTSAPVDMSGWSVQYNSATGVAAYSGITPFPAGTTIKAHGYFMIQEQGAAGTTSTFVPTPDIATTGTAFGAGSNNFNMSGSAGKIALVNNSTTIAAQPTLPSASIIDLVSYGTTAVYYEGTGPAPAPSATTTIQRKASATSTAATMAAGGTEASAGNGYDTDDNASNFVSQAAPNPHNSASPVASGGGGGSTAGPTLTATPTTLTFSQLVNAASPAQTVTVTGTALTTSVTVTVAAPYSISTSAAGTYSTTLTLSSTQVASGTPVYVEFTPTVAGAANGTLTVASTGATTQTVTLNGTGLSTLSPTLTTSVNSLDFSNTTGIGASATKTFTLSGANLTAGATLTVTGAGYTISTDGTTFGATATIAAAFTTAQTITVKFTPTVTTAATGSIAITSTNATTQTVTLTGTGIQLANTPPTLNTVANIALCYTATPQTVALSGITPGSEPAQSLIISVSATNPALFSQIGVFPIAGGTTGQLNYTVAPNASGTSAVTITLKDNGGTTNGGVDTYTSTFNITVNAIPNVSIVSNVGTNITKGVTAQLSATAGGTTYVWTGADIVSGQNTASLIVRPKASGTYSVVVTNATGCSTTQTISLNVSTSYPLVTSNIITPNGDGKNDTWIVKNIDFYPTSNVKVVDKAGKVVFTANGYQNDWAGTYNGQPLTQGTYYYVIDLGTGAPKYTGYITLIRD